MDAMMKNGWKQQNPSGIQYYPSQSFQKQSNPGMKSHKKKVQFKSHTPRTKQDTVGNGKYHPSGTLGLKQSTSEEYDQMPPSMNMYSPDVPIADTNAFCSGRAAVLTFIIVILIISAAGIAIGITIAATKSSASSSGTGTGSNSNNNNPNSVSTPLTMVATSSINIGSQTGAPCSAYTTIDDPTRNIYQNGSYGSCDRGSLFNATDDGSWIRFIGVGGTTMAATSPGRLNCGAFLSAWFNDTLPTTVGSVYNGTVCLSGSHQPCVLMMRISVVNCGGFYIYLLPSMPVCSARYCTA